MDIKETSQQTTQIDLEDSKNNESNVSTKTIAENKPIYFYRNNTVAFINEFYKQFYSFSCFKLMDWIWIILWLIVVIVSLYFTVIFFPLDFISQIVKLFIMYGLVALVSYKIGMLKEKRIVESYNKMNSANFKTIYEVSDDWLKKQIGQKYATIEYIKSIEEWRAYQEKYSMYYKLPLKKYTYTQEAKPRIISLTIALLSVLGLIVFNIFKPQNPYESIEYIDTLYHTPQLLELIGSTFILTTIFFYLLVFSCDLLKQLICSLPLHLHSNQLSEANYKKFMAFLVHKLEVSKFEKEK